MNNYVWVIITLILMVMLITSGHWIIALIFSFLSAIIWLIQWFYKFGS